MCILINREERALIDSKTGQIVRPSCFDDLVAYHAYLISGKNNKLANQVLKDVFAGEKVISNMVAEMRQGLTYE